MPNLSRRQGLCALSAATGFQPHAAQAATDAANTTAFQKAIEAANAAGGGRVVVPAGLFLTGAIHLSAPIRNVRLRNCTFEQVAAANVEGAHDGLGDDQREAGGIGGAGIA